MKKIKISFIDICIVVMVILLAAVGYLFLKSGGDAGAETAKLNITVLATNQQEGISELVKPDDDVVISFSEDVHATVTEAYEEPFKDYYYNSFTGKYVQSTIKGKSNVYVKLTCDVKVTDTEMSKDNLPIRVGEEMPVRGMGYVIKGYVIEITEE